jgi:DNA-binding CsgD family transcriptional regulator
MTLRYRPMRPKDVRECVEVVTTHPVIAPRYGGAIAHLRSAWLKLCGQEAFRAVVFEDMQDSQARMIGCGVSAFVSDDFIAELKKPPFFWAAPELVRRVMSGNSPLLSDKQVRQANCDGGLNLLVWEGTTRTEDFSRPEVLHAIFNAFAEQHRGFLLKELISHSVTVESLEGMIHSGGLFLSPDGSYVDNIAKPLCEVLAEPHYFGLTRDLARRRFGTWIGSLFAYQPPRLGLRRSEQRLLLTALCGGTDEDLADELGISISAVKKTWHSIYDRVVQRAPGLVPKTSIEHGTTERGKEKKQRLLAYLRDHPEELRPGAL